MKSNEQIRSDVLQQFHWNSDVQAADIAVAVDHGAVTLSGTVPNREIKMMAMELAQKVQGVQRVVQHLKVTAKA